MSRATEANFDGLVGPTHNYSGLSFGNVASTSHRARDSSPLQAVLQGLAKMKALADLGFHQGVLPPQERPDLHALRRLGFHGPDKRVLEEVARQAPELISEVCSASAMWTANAATVGPSADARDGKVHFTPANLLSKFHRSIEPPTTARVLKRIFKAPSHFTHHDPLAGTLALGDEGAANHTRLCSEYGSAGVQLFVFGRWALRSGLPQPQKFPARQTFEASAALARHHRLDPAAVVFAQQHPDAIDAGVFHNDVAGVGNQYVYFFHRQSFVDTEVTMAELREKFARVCGGELREIAVSSEEVSLPDAVRSYLFNSQLLTLEGGRMALIAPVECETVPSVQAYLKRLVADARQPIREVRFFDLRESMRNGGGPACLRLRVVLTEKERKAVHSKIWMDDRLYGRLVTWAKKHYREVLHVDDLRDPLLVRESRAALDQLTGILGLGSAYEFQRV